MSSSPSLLAQCETLNFERGDEIYTEGQIDDRVFLIKAGKITLFKTKGDDIVEVDFLSANQIFGFNNFLLEEKRRYTAAIATEKTVLLDLSPLFEDQINASSPLIRLLLKTSCLSLHHTYNEIRKLQYFEKIHYENYKDNTLHIYHLRDILRFCILLKISFQHGNYSLKLDQLENTIQMLLSRVTVKLDVILKVLINAQIITLTKAKETDNTLSLINVELLENFINFFQKRFVKDPKKLLLSDPQLLAIEAICKMADEDNLRALQNYFARLNTTVPLEPTLEQRALIEAQKLKLNNSELRFTKEDFAKVLPNSAGSLTALSEKGIILKSLAEISGVFYIVVKKDIFEVLEHQRIIKIMEKSL